MSNSKITKETAQAGATRSPLACKGGPKAVKSDPSDLTTWPYITKEDEDAALEVIRGGIAMSGWDISLKFEQEFAQWQGCKHAVTYPNGTAALLAAMWAIGIGAGDEVICPSITYWASAMPCFALGAAPVFADIEPDTQCLDSKDIERHITERTKAIVVVHYKGYPADMDAIMEVADEHGLKVLEDVSHAQGGLCKGRRTGSFGHVSAASLMSGKSLVAGEGGMLWTEDQEIFDRALAWGHYNRFKPDISTEYLRPFAGLPMGGVKGRLNQVAAAIGRVQLKHYDKRCAVVRKAINHFWDQLVGLPGVRGHRVDESTGSNMAGWYSPGGHYLPEELHGLSLTAFVRAVKAEGTIIQAGGNSPLHLHPVFSEADIYGHGQPTRTAFTGHETRQPRGSLPVSEAFGARTFRIARFSKFDPERIAEHAEAYRKVIENHEELLDDDPGNPEVIGGWSTTFQ